MRIGRKSALNFRLVFSTASAVGLAMGAAACSPSSFFNNGTDSSILNQPTYNKVNTACDQVNLRSAEMDAPTFRSLLHCFNAYGALNEIEAVTNQLSDADLQPIITLTNKHLLLDKKHLYQTLSSYNDLKNQHKTAPLLQALGKTLGDGEFVAAAAKLAGEIYQSDKPAFLAMLNKLSSKANLDSATQGMEFATNLGSAPSFNSLQSSFRSSVSGDQSLDSISSSLLIYLQDQNHLSIPRVLVPQLINGGLFGVADQLFTANIAGDVSRQSAGFYGLFRNRAQIFSGMNSLFGSLDGPISCLDGTQSIANGDEQALTEIAGVDLSDPDSASHFIARSKLLLLTLAGSTCNFPPQVALNYPALEALASTRAVIPVVQLTQAMVAHPSYERLMINLLKDSGLPSIAPMLGELAYRGTFPDLLLLMTSLRPEDRPAIQSALQYIFSEESASNRAGKSIYDVIASGLASADKETLYRMIHGMQVYADSTAPILSPASQAIKTLSYMNNVHPLLEVIHDVLQEASQNSSLYDSVFKMAALRQFSPAVKLLGAMSQDGRLEQILDALATLYNHYALQGQMPIVAAVEPIFTNRLRHQLKAADLVHFDTTETEDYSSCRQIQIDVNLDNPSDPRFAAQWTNYLACLNNDGHYLPIVDSVNFLRTNQNLEGQNYFDYTINLTQSTNLDLPEKQYLATVAMNALKGVYGSFNGQLELLPKLFKDSFLGRGDLTSGPVFESIFKLARPIFAHRASFDHLLTTAGGLIGSGNSDLPGALELTQKIVSRLDDPILQPQPEAVTTYFDKPRIKRWLQNKECEYFPFNTPDSVLEERANELIEDYQNETVNYILDPATQHTKSGAELSSPRQYRHWTKALLREHLNPILEKFADPTRRADATHSPVKALMSFFTDFYGGKDPKDLNTLQAWIQNHSDRWVLGDPEPSATRLNPKRILTYMYVNEEHPEYDEPFPRVKIVNAVDLFELILINSNVITPTIEFDFPKLPKIVEQNSALEFMAILAEAWGDDPYEKWPKEIQEKFPPSSKSQPRTLRQAVQVMIDTTSQLALEAGVSETAGCKQVANPSDPLDVQKQETQDPVQKFGLPDSSSLPGPLRSIYAAAIKNLLKMSPAEAKAHLYNELEMLKAVMEDNLPDNPALVGHPLLQDGGLKLFRNLFFELYYSTPVQYRNAVSGDRNNLSLVVDVCKLGVTHMMVKAASGFKPMIFDAHTGLVEFGDSELHDLMRAFLQGASNPTTPVLFDSVLTDVPNYKPDLGFTLAWNLIDQFHNVILAGQQDLTSAQDLENLCASQPSSLSDLDDQHRKEICKNGYPLPPDQIREIQKKVWVPEALRLKQGGFYIFAGAQLPSTDPKEAALIDLALPFLNDTINSSEANRKFLASTPDILSELLRMEAPMVGARAYYEIQDQADRDHLLRWITPPLQDSQNGIAAMDILNGIGQKDSGAVGVFSTTVHRWKALTDPSSGYKFPLWNIDSASETSTEALLNYFSDQSGGMRQTSALKIRQFIDQQILTGANGKAPAADEYLALMAKNPDGFYQIPVAVSAYIHDGSVAGNLDNHDLEDFFQLILRTLAPAAR